MNEISIYSTPTFRFRFRTFNVSDISNAWLTVKCGSVKIQKPLEESFIEDDMLCWTLTQEETKTLPENMAAKVMCDWLVGTRRGRSLIGTYKVTETGREEVMA